MIKRLILILLAVLILSSTALAYQETIVIHRQGGYYDVPFGTHGRCYQRNYCGNKRIIIIDEGRYQGYGNPYPYYQRPRDRGYINFGFGVYDGFFNFGYGWER